MTDATQYPYSKNYSIATIALMLVLMLLLFINVVKANDKFTWVIYGVCSVIFITLMILLVIKRLIPAFKGAVALELNGEGIIDYVGNVTINWSDIKEISLLPGRSSSAIVVELQWESDHGSSVSISLRWVKGQDEAIFETMQMYLAAA